MSAFNREIPDTEQVEAHTKRVTMPKTIPELEFPRKLEDCDVRVYHGSEFRGRYSTDECEIWLLAPNIVKVDSGTGIWVTYNAIVEVSYHTYPVKG